MAIKRIMTGTRPTGPLHLGHYAGALKMWAELQDDYECFFMIADIQALTTHVDQPKLIEQSVKEVLLDFFAAGLDPRRENVHFILQSGIPELSELTNYFTMLVPFSELERNPTIKAERLTLKSSPTAGFMIYPISQAADILFCSPMPHTDKDELLVPVGADQVPHLEETNRVARAFNKRYGELFLECKPKLSQFARLPGTDGAEKMSKSLGNAIFLGDSEEIVNEKVRSMYTDPTKLRKGDPGHPENCPAYLYHQIFGDQNTLENRASRCRSGDLGCVECKGDLAKSLNEFLDPIRERRKKAEKLLLGKYLLEGTKYARAVAENTVKHVRSAMHLDYPSILK